MLLGCGHRSYLPGVLTALLFIGSGAGPLWAADGESNTVEPGLLMQSHLQYSTPSDSVGLTLERVRPKLRGKLADGALRFRFGVELAEESVRIKSAYFDVRILEDDWIVRVGHFKRPYSRQRLTGVSRQGLADRPLTDSAFDADRDLGVLFHNGRGAGLEWAVALTGASDLDNPDDSVVPTLSGRLGYASRGLKGYQATDRTGGSFRFGVATSVLAFLREVVDKPQGLRWEVDAIAKWQGFTISTAVFGKTQSLDTMEHDAIGVLGHLGWRFMDELEVIARCATVLGSSETQTQINGGLTGYLYEDHLTIRLDGVWDHPEDTVDVRLQMQLRL